MKRGLFIIILILILLFSLSLVTANKYTDLETMTIKQTISNDISIIPLKIPLNLDYFESTLLLVPLSSNHQEVSFISYDPQPKEVKETQVLFRVDEYSDNDIGFSLDSRVITNGDRFPVTSKVSFPLKDIPDEVSQYTEFTSSIDSNSKISRTANSLANGVDDLYELEFLLATWVEENIHYNLSSLTADANKPSSWVIQEGKGVCDEITNLFISLNRALGIPARFVSGVAYTDSDLFDYPWGNHGWAEVYFPGHGWVPFDISYKQLGYIDASHVELRKDVDGTSNSVKYTHRGDQSTYSINTGSLDFDSIVVKEGSVKDKLLSAKFYAQEDVIGFGSYDILFLEIKNNAPYYLVDFIQVAKTIDIKQEGPLNRFVYLKPYETKTIPFLIQSNANLDPYLIYTYPFTAFVEGESYKAEVSILSKGEVFSETYVKQFLVDEDEKALIEVSCISDAEVMVNSSFKITCFPSSDASLPLTVCLDSSCKKISSLKDEIHFDYSSSKLGVQTIVLSQKSNGKSSDIFSTFKVIDNAKLSFDEISLDDTINFDEEKSLKISIKKDSFAKASNVTVKIKHSLFLQEWNFPVFDENKQFELLIRGNNLGFSKNDIDVIVEYYDSFGVKQTIKETKVIELVDLKFMDKVIIMSNVINSKIINLMSDIFNIEDNSPNLKAISAISLISILISAFVVLKIVLLIIKAVLSPFKREPKVPKKLIIKGTKKEKHYMHKKK